MITEEMYKKVEAKVISTVNKINEHYKINMKVPPIYYDVYSTIGGLAKFKTMSVHFNPKLMLENFDDYLKTTVPHEVCHIGVWQKTLHEKKSFPKAHGAEWKLMMWVVGAPARRTHEYDTEEVKRTMASYEYHCACNKPLVVGPRIHSNIKNKKKSYQCVKCGTVLKNGTRILQLGFSKASPNNTTKIREED